MPPATASNWAMSFTTIRRIAGFAGSLALLGIPAFAQGFDTSGTPNLTGDYFVRELLLADIDHNNSTVGRALSLTGVMTFDGQGGYSFTGQMMDTKTGQPTAINGQTGVYAMSANGFVQIQDVIDTNQTDFGGSGLFASAQAVSIVASTTEGPQKNIFIAIPAGSGASNTALQGTYKVAFIDFLLGDASNVRDGYFTAATAGDGRFGNVSVHGAMANQGSTDTTQTARGVTYNITDPSGIGTLTFPATPSLSSLVGGQKTLYVSADSSIFIAGDPEGFDLMIGIPALTSAATDGTYQGTYYTGGIENNAADLANGNNNVDAFAGSIFSLGQGTTISHLRLATFNSNAAIDYTYEPAPYTVASDGTFNDNMILGILGAGGEALLEVGTGTFYSLTAGFGSLFVGQVNPFLDPLKVWNAASFAPITNSVAPGQFVSLFGTGLASTTAQAESLPLPTTLGNVQVTVNGVLAPIQYVSANQINILVPYATSGGYATFQVSNDIGVSNAVTLYEVATAPGVFASTNGGFAPGVGPAAALHADFAPVTQDDPALIGETLLLYVTGLGSVTPAVADGDAAPSSPLSHVDADIGVFVDGQPANVSFKGLAPGFAGLYQLNFDVPSGVSGGLVYVAVSTPEAYTTQAKLYIKSSGAVTKPKRAFKRLH